MQHKEIESYLAGLITGDGYLERKNSRIIISTVNNEFKEIISNLIKLIGLKPRIKFDKINRTKT